jgi:hypothetical protein
LSGLCILVGMRDLSYFDLNLGLGFAGNRLTGNADYSYGDKNARSALFKLDGTPGNFKVDVVGG